MNCSGEALPGNAKKKHEFKVRCNMQTAVRNRDLCWQPSFTNMQCSFFSVGGCGVNHINLTSTHIHLLANINSCENPGLQSTWRDCTWKIDEWNAACRHIGNLSVRLSPRDVCDEDVTRGAERDYSVSLWTFCVASCRQCVDVHTPFNEQFSGLTGKSNEKRHRRRRPRVQNAVVQMIVLLHNK